LALAIAATPAAAAVDTGVIRLAQPEAPSDPQNDANGDPVPKAGARRGFDVEAFDSRFETLWFQRKAYLAEGRDEDASRQSDLIRDFVAEESVRRLESPAGALLLESKAWLREGSHRKALAALSLAEALDPGRPQIAVARAHALSASGAGFFPAAAEWARAVRATLLASFRDLNIVDELAIIAVFAVAGTIVLFSVFMALRYQVVLRHDVEERLILSGHETWAKAGGWAVLLLPCVLVVGVGWLFLYWLAALFRYMRGAERVVAVLLLAAGALIVPAYRLSIGLYGLAADPTVRTTIAAANGGYDPDRIVKLRALVDLHPDDPIYRFLLAGLYKNGRYFDDAFQEYKRVLDAAPSTYQARINVGNIYFALGQYGEAISNYRQAIDVRPDSVLAYYDMYLAQSDCFKLKEAAESLAKARDFDAARTASLLTAGSREGGGAKVIDATIDFDSIWRASVEGRRLREWLGGAADEPRWTSALPLLANTTSVLALAALAACGLLNFMFRGHAPAQRCTRCGNPFCSECKSVRDGHEYCSQCLHLFVLGDGLAPETKSMKLYQVERHEAWGRRGRRVASLVLPGASQLLTGRAASGVALMTLWLFAWLGGFPEGAAPLERALGFAVHVAGLRPSVVPALYGLDAVVVLAIPLGALAWLAGNVGFRRARGA
jgi:tetratricopeptide (TPR) repeat protein